MVATGRRPGYRSSVLAVLGQCGGGEHASVMQCSVVGDVSCVMMAGYVVVVKDALEVKLWLKPVVRDCFVVCSWGQGFRFLCCGVA